jgi:hypothetical protein
MLPGGDDPTLVVSPNLTRVAERAAENTNTSHALRKSAKRVFSQTPGIQ